jgi:hypothetical protein
MHAQKNTFTRFAVVLAVVWVASVGVAYGVFAYLRGSFEVQWVTCVHIVALIVAAVSLLMAANAANTAAFASHEVLDVEAEQRSQARARGEKPRPPDRAVHREPLMIMLAELLLAGITAPMVY